MARKSAAQSPEVETIEVIETPDELQSALSRLYADADTQPDEAVAHVYLVEADAEPKIWKGSPADYDLEALAKRFGSGNYRLKVYVKTEAGNFALKINKVFPYRISAEEDARLRGIRKGEILPASQQQAPISAESLTAAIIAGIRTLMPQSPAPANNLGMLKEVAEIVRTLAPQPIAPAFNPMDMMRVFADFSRERGEDEPLKRGVNANGTDVFLRLIDKFAPLFERTLMNGAATAALPAPGVEAQQVESVAQTVQPGVQAVKSPEDDAMMKLRMGLGFLCMQAAADNEPETYADVVLDNVPPEDLEKFLQNPDPVGYLAKVHPEVAKHAKWFGLLLASVKEEFAEADKPPVESEKTAS